MCDTEGPYTYPHTERVDIIAVLGDHRSCCSTNAWNSGFCVAWHVKVPYNVDTSGAAYRSDFGFETRFDEAWDKYLEQHREMFCEVWTDVISRYTNGEWTRYPGIEQGEYKFGFNGPSGGYLMIKDWPGPTPSPGTTFPMIWDNRDDYQGWLKELRDNDLNKFYRVIVQLDRDLSRNEICKAIDQEYAFRRSLWEDEQRKQEESAARELEASRPDMYP